MPERICSVDDCEKPVRALGYCAKHEWRFKRYGDPLMVTRAKRPRFEPVQCTVTGCEQMTSLKSYGGMCEMHCARLRRTGSLNADNFQPRKDQTPAEILWLRSEPHGSCVLWTGFITPDGYGRVGASWWGTGSAHRYSWMLVHGPIPDGLEIDHVCHSRDAGCQDGNDCLHRRCINPDHLEVVTHAENTRRCWERTPVSR